MSHVGLCIVDQCEVLQLIQLTHLLASLTQGAYILIGCMAHYNQAYPIYCDKIFKGTQPWHEILTLIGMLLIARQEGVMQLHNLFAEKPECGKFINAIEPKYCWSDNHNKLILTWTLAYNYWGTTVTLPSGIAEPEELFTEELNEAPSREPAVSGLHSSLSWRDSNGPGCTTWVKANTSKHILVHEVKRSPWGRIIVLTRLLFTGNLWVGEYPNSFKILLEDIQRLITNCFLTALHMVSQDHQQILNEPETIPVRWPVFHINAGMRKIVKGTMVHTNFGSSVSLEKRIKDLVTLFNSGHLSQVQEAISDLIDKQVFRELLWASLFHPISDLADGRHDRTDFVKVQLFGAETDESSLDLDSESVANFYGANEMNNVIMLALDVMYNQLDRFETFTETVKYLPFVISANVLPISPKTGAPRLIGTGKVKATRTMDDIEDIEIQPICILFGKLPNCRGCSYLKSMRTVWDLPISYFMSTK
ncbi:hypothetical protein F4604DRAFT_1686076 [Suillus subluteus]|nr:hypothetical protein F4604DRAFT_1686076 [Suillus subluteus]